MTNLSHEQLISGEFVTLNTGHGDERYYAIRNYDQMDPFFISLISNADHWLFISSTGGLSAGRVQPENALFPYVTVDKIHENYNNTGSKTLVRVSRDGQVNSWEPFNQEQNHRYEVSRNLYKNFLGDKILFEEINHELQVAFRYSWATSDAFGFVRDAEVVNLADSACEIELVDGIQNLMAAGTNRHEQTETSYLVDAYKWNQLDESTGLGMFSLYATLADNAEPSESLNATTVYQLGLEQPQILVSNEQLKAFRNGQSVSTETLKRGLRGAYFVSTKLSLAANCGQQWRMVSELEQSQTQVAAVRRQLLSPVELHNAIDESIAKDADELARIIGAADGFQQTAEEATSTHHYANVLFNVLRGGIFDNQYTVDTADFRRTLSVLNKQVLQRHLLALEALPEQMDYNALLGFVRDQGDRQLERLCYEYLPITFGRRHGDPSRPWNHFAIKLKDEQGNRLLSYQGNWRDIFQNWEALGLSFPEFTENVIAKFVNASTIDGFNPYRITKEGIDWERPDPEDPWAHIGYWGDHQIIYLQKLLEWSKAFHPERLSALLEQPLFCYANVPYIIKSYDELLQDAENTVDFDKEKDAHIEELVSQMGSDGRLVLDKEGAVYQVNLTEKLLVPLLSKLSNLVLDGGIWLNTQRPEWNDANNALVGQGLSMVTLYYMRRYVLFMQDLLQALPESVEISVEVSQWLEKTADALSDVSGQLNGKPVTAELRTELLRTLGEAASDYRGKVYANGFSGKGAQSIAAVQRLLTDSLVAIDHSIKTNLRADGLYHAYNVLDLTKENGELDVDYLYAMLEGQVSVLSSGAVSPREAADILDKMFASDFYRADQKTFMLYPDRDLPDFLAKNQAPAAAVESNELLKAMLANGDNRLIEQDCEGAYRFNSAFKNARGVAAVLETLAAESAYAAAATESRQAVLALYEQVFDHQSFTGRSGTMFGFEGLGCIFWHMVSKLLLAAQENYFAAVEQGEDEALVKRLADLYYRVREGLGFNKTPELQGAFPCDPYSHTPKHAGAQQPGMTGQVKEEVITRWGELGLRIADGQLRLAPSLLRKREFVSEPAPLRYLDVADKWQQITVPANSLAFTWTQVPFIYSIDESAAPAVTLHWSDGRTETLDSLILSAEQSLELFNRSGRITRVELVLNESQLLGE